MSTLTFTWTVQRLGWAVCTVADSHGCAEAVASYVTNGPEQLLRAAAGIAGRRSPTRAEFDAEGWVYRWLFDRQGNDVDIRLIKVADFRDSDRSGVLVWTGHHSVRVLADAVIHAFDAVYTDLGPEGYNAAWGHPFPLRDLEALRTAARDEPPGLSGARTRP